MTESAESTVCVHGLGYVGLPTAAILTNSGYTVYGYDADPEKRAALRDGEIDFDEAAVEEFVSRALRDGLEVTDGPRAADFHLICVPTPYDQALDRTNLSYVEAAGEALGPILRQGDTVVLESTVPPGTTANRLRDLIEEHRFAVPSEVRLAYSPETILPGNTLAELRNNDRIVGFVGDTDPAPVVSLYKSFVTGDVRVTDATTAEFVKLIQNASRDVNIAFANEIAKLAHEFEIDARDAISLANNHPRVDILSPGPGVGGHCIPIDPLFLGHGNDIPMLIETARQVNDDMPLFVLNLLSAALDDLSEASVALLGVAYKGGIADTRQSPSLALRDLLVEEGVEDVRLTDPHVTDGEFDIQELETAVKGSDAAVIVTDHPVYSALSPERFERLMGEQVVLDTRGLINSDHWETAGFDVYQL
ncbi:nucleotide sugar dehydrogenase [Halomicrobium katesii]|uniref:nucleotide sugar dehydrogenase n=1 Tax=Halomicrobium katesii TaxID=437163 RepID=UPI00036D6F25|nr:nucleotide sugar dehydrogenase [Halomicrobium katesii]